MENKIIENEPAEDCGEDKFRKFSERRRKFYTELYSEFGTDSYGQMRREKEDVAFETEVMQEALEQYKNRVKELRTEIDFKKSSLLKRIIEFYNIRKLERQLGILERSQEIQEKETEKKLELIGYYDRLIAEENELGELMEKAQKENVEWDEKKRLEFVESEKKRDVSALARKHKVFFVHDIVVAEWKPSENNKVIDTKKLSFNDQLDILHGLNPTISASTLHKNSRQTTFGDGSWGVFLCNGRVLGGDKSDAGSIAVGLRDRRFHNKESTTTEAIDNAIKRKNFSSEEDRMLESEIYNEFIVENPEIAGVYLKWDDSMPDLAEKKEICLKNTKGARYDNWWSRIADVMKRDMPIFVLNRKNNIVRLLYDVNVENKVFKMTPEFDPEDMTDMVPRIYQKHLGDEEKKRAVMRIFDKAVGIIPEDERSKYISGRA